MSKNKSVFVLRVSHGHGTDILASLSESGALKALYNFVAEFWDSDEAIENFSQQEAIDAYFEQAEDEDYEIVKTILLP